jgi:hypothetical protein
VHVGHCSSLEARKDGTLFKHVLLPESTPWDSATADDNLRLLLPGFDYEGSNSVVLRGLVPDNDGTIEIALSPDGSVEEEVFFLFKVNMGLRKVSSHAKVDSAWEDGQTVTYRIMPFRAGVPFFLRIVMCPDGYGLYVNGSHLCDMTNVHRTKTGRTLPKGQKLFVVLRKSGDYGETRSLRALGMYWGHSRHAISAERVPQKRRRTDGDGEPDPQVAFVKNLPGTMTLTRLMEIAGAYGTVIDVDQPTRGHSRVTFEDPKSVTAMIAGFSGQDVDGSRVEVEVGRRMAKAMRTEGGAGGAGGPGY